MMPWVAFAFAGVGTALFAAVFILGGVLRVTRQLMDQVTQGVSTMLDASLSDEVKERAVRKAGLALLKGAFALAWRFALALGLAAVPALIADRLGLIPVADVLAALLHPGFIIGVTALALLAAWRWPNRRNADTSYSPAERMFHAVAFSGPVMLRRLAALDDWLFAKRVSQHPDTPPVFVTSLARGGTTALLNALSDMPQFATHRYSDMPFISAPFIWSKLAGRRRVAERARAHGDGLMISLQSPEAFDEVFWHLFWPEKYQSNRIEPWAKADHSPKAQAFFTRHFRKIVALRRPNGAGQARYLSKNNANIARLHLLPQMFPGCTIVIALRDPAAHATSLYRQHLNFERQHEQDPFIRRYMRDIGHFEFGDLHTPLGFDMGALAGYAPDDPNYWLRYWITAFSHVAAHDGPLHIVTQADLRRAPNATMRALLVDIHAPLSTEMDFSAYFHDTPDTTDESIFTPALLREARAVFAELAASAVHRDP